MQGTSGSVRKRVRLASVVGAVVTVCALVAGPSPAQAASAGTIDQSQALHTNGAEGTCGDERLAQIVNGGLTGGTRPRRPPHLARRFQHDRRSARRDPDRVARLPDRDRARERDGAAVERWHRLPDLGVRHCDLRSPRDGPRRPAVRHRRPRERPAVHAGLLVVVRRRPRVSGRRRPFPQRRELVLLGWRQRPGLRVQDLRGHVLPIGRYPQRVPPTPRRRDRADHGVHHMSVGSAGVRARREHPPRRRLRLDDAYGLGDPSLRWRTSPCPGTRGP